MELEKKVTSLRNNYLFIIGSFIVVAVLPIFLSKYHTILLVQALLYGMFAMSLDLIMGYAGIVSFGHGAFFGIGAYTFGLSLVKGGFSIWMALAFVIIITSFYGYLVGYFSSRLKGIYFAILTLAFAEVVYRIVFYSDFTGGSDGLIGIPNLPLSIKGIFSISIDTPQRFCYFTLIVVFLSYLILRKITISPFGKVLEAIRENEERSGFLGFNVNQYKIISFVVSGCFAGLSGALYSFFMGFADPEQLHFMLHGKVVIMVLLGGMGTLVGPIIGGMFVTIFEIIMSHYTKSFMIIVGLTFIFVVIFMPEGFAGAIRNRFSKYLE